MAQSQQMTESAPTPWIKAGASDIRADDGYLVAMVNPTGAEMAKARAPNDRSIIIEAVNSHEALKFRVAELEGRIQESEVRAAAYCDTMKALERTSGDVRAAVIEECISELQTSYPGHAWLNAACAALRALSQAPATSCRFPNCDLAGCKCGPRSLGGVA